MSVRGADRSVEMLTARLASEGLSAQPWGNGPGDRYAVHQHGYDKVLLVVQGSITFDLPGLGRSVELDPGDRLDLPAGTAHGADVGPKGVTCLEAHLASGTLDPDLLLHPRWDLKGPAETVPWRTA